MDDKTKRVLIIAGAILLAVLIYVYFSPYHSCKRDVGGRYAAEYCARNLSK